VPSSGILRSVEGDSFEKNELGRARGACGGGERGAQGSGGET